MRIKLLQNKVVKNASWIIIARIAQSLIGFVIGMITARYLGPSNYGLISYAASIVAFVVPIMNLGFNNVLVHELTMHPDEEGKIIGSSILLSIISSIICIVGLVFFTFIIDAGEPITTINCKCERYSVKV